MKQLTGFFLFTIFLSCPLTAQKTGENAALLVIDIQDEFTHHTMDDERATALISNVNEAIAALRPMQVIFVRADIRMLVISLKGIKTESSEYAELDKRLDRREGDLVLNKQESSALTVEELNSVLEKNRVGHLYLTGIFLGKCLSNTAINAIEEGYKVTVIRQAVTAKKDRKSEKFLTELEARGVLVADLSDL